jgi:hypothetical protein
LIILVPVETGVVVLANSLGSVRFPNVMGDSLDVSAIQEISNIEVLTHSIEVGVEYSEIILIGSVRIDSLTEDFVTTGILVGAATSF